MKTEQENKKPKLSPASELYLPYPPSSHAVIFFDQDLLAIVYRNRWRPLPYVYNALKPMRACHAPLWRDADVRVLHYILDKPWKSRAFDANDTIQSTHRLWWDEFAEVEREWKQAGEADEEKRKLWENVVKPVVVQE